MYQFCNGVKLKELKAEGQNDVLTITTPTESARVVLHENQIKEVLHIDLVKKTERLITSKDFHHIVVGQENYERDVYHYLKPNPEKHLQLRLGLTVHKGKGTWSSLPHAFENNLEPDFEEVFFYLLKGGSERAFQVGRGVWCDGSPVDAVWPVKDRIFATIPLGYHPVVGEPGVEVRYVWAYLVKKKEWEKI